MHYVSDNSVCTVVSAQEGVMSVQEGVMSVQKGDNPILMGW